MVSAKLAGDGCKASVERGGNWIEAPSQAAGRPEPVGRDGRGYDKPKGVTDGDGIDGDGIGEISGFAGDSESVGGDDNGIAAGGLGGRDPGDEAVL
jgi:hypothetical protein